MYTIGNIIYGVPINDRVRGFIARCNEELTEEEYSELFNDEEQLKGFAHMYHGGCIGLVGYCGIPIGEFDVIEDVLIDSIPQPSEEQIAQANEMIEALPKVVRALIPEVGHYIVWSSS